MRLSLLLLPLLLAIAPPAGAETFPERPIRIIVPINPGGGTDIFARKLAELAGPMLGQNVITENRPGASGTIGVPQLVEARPDGYTLGCSWNTPLTSARVKPSTRRLASSRARSDNCMRAAL